MSEVVHARHEEAEDEQSESPMPVRPRHGAGASEQDEHAVAWSERVEQATGPECGRGIQDEAGQVQRHAERGDGVDEVPTTKERAERAPEPPEPGIATTADEADGRVGVG